MEIEIKTTMRYRSTLLYYQKGRNNMCWRGCREKWNPYCCRIEKWWNCHKKQNGGFSKN